MQFIFRVTLVCTLLGTISAMAADRPNVLLIMADDLNTSLACYGHPVVKSPNLDRLAAGGMRFERAYCNYPVCNPSRVSMLSGLRAETTKVLDNVTKTRQHLADAVMLPEFFRKQGYRTIKVGKIYHTGEGFEDPQSWDLDILETAEAKDPRQEQVIRRQGSHGIVLRAADEDTWDGFVARKAAELIEQAATTQQPFFVAAGFRRPHTPYIATEKYFQMYKPDELFPRMGPSDHTAKIPDLALTYRTGVNPKLPEANPGDTIAAYYASISYMDAQIGHLLETLDRLNLHRNTIVAFVSDHGYHLGEHGGLWHKLSLFEECARVPLIISAPGYQPGSTFGLVELIDLYPTLVDLCGFDVPDQLQGQSAKRLLHNPNAPSKPAVHTVVSRPVGSIQPGDSKFGDISRLGRTVFDGRWRFTLWPDGTTELYDHHDDPLEYNNLMSSAATNPHAARLRQWMDQGK